MGQLAVLQGMPPPAAYSKTLLQVLIVIPVVCQVHHLSVGAELLVLLVVLVLLELRVVLAHHVRETSQAAQHEQPQQDERPQRQAAVAQLEAVAAAVVHDTVQAGGATVALHSVDGEHVVPLLNHVVHARDSHPRAHLRARAVVLLLLRAHQEVRRPLVRLELLRTLELLREVLREGQVLQAQAHVRRLAVVVLPRAERVRGTGHKDTLGALLRGLDTGAVELALRGELVDGDVAARGGVAHLVVLVGGDDGNVEVVLVKAADQDQVERLAGHRPVRHGRVQRRAARQARRLGGDGAARGRRVAVATLVAREDEPVVLVRRARAARAASQGEGKGGAVVLEAHGARTAVHAHAVLRPEVSLSALRAATCGVLGPSLLAGAAASGRLATRAAVLARDGAVVDSNDSSRKQEKNGKGCGGHHCCCEGVVFDDFFCLTMKYRYCSFY
eukprot:Rhum_TRINITY_DN14679_c0_g1::Rhum_TRINITY_DN14679_c0_g1_i1::g.110315::m.110315